MVFRLKEDYKNRIKSELQKELNIKNPMCLPALDKIVISVGAGEAMKDNKLMQNIADTISLIAGQKAVITKAKKSVAGFKIREGMPSGVKVTLRGNRMYEFLERLISAAIPRIKDFNGVHTKFDGHGNYTLGIEEQIIFPEIEIEKVYKITGMNITFVTDTDSDEEAYDLLKEFGFPFKKN